MQRLDTLKRYILTHKKVSLVCLFLVVWAVSSYVFFKRFPNNYIYSNFFAEDGQHFTQNIIDKGFLGALLTPFNGYFIFGIYLLTEFGFVLNHIFFSGRFVSLPQSLAISSYIFLGLCAALPIVLLKKYISLLFRLAISLLIILLPLPSFDYGIIGTIGNLKFAFAFIAFLLVLYRITLPKQSYRIILIDLILVFCAFTTAGVYLIIPYILWSNNFGKDIYLSIRKRNISLLFSRKNISLWSGVGLFVLCLVQVLYILTHGVPKLPGYLDQPYEFSKTIEVFIARPYLYPLVNALYHHLTNTKVLMIFVVLAALAIRFGKKKNVKLYIIGITSIFTTTLVFVYNRTGTAHYYDHYSTSGFDNFFYTQNFIAIILGVVLLSDIVVRSKIYIRYTLPVLIILGLIAGSIHTNTSYAPNDFMQYQIGTLEEQTKTACGTQKTGDITFSVYPFTFLTMKEPRSTICDTNLAHSQSLIQDLSTGNPNYYKSLDINPGTNTFTQTFTANQDHLSAIAIYLSTYYQPLLKNYSFKLMDKRCKTVIQNISMPLYVRDNAFRTIDLNDISGSKNTTFCFSITPSSKDAQQLAIQTTPAPQNSTLKLTLNGTAVDQNIVFDPVYSN